MVKNKQTPFLNPEFRNVISIVSEAYFYKLQGRASKAGGRKDYWDASETMLKSVFSVGPGFLFLNRNIEQSNF